MHNIYWNTTNPIFRIDNTDHIIDINAGGNLPTEYDQANIICPRYRSGTSPANVETYIIYNVSREEYETCRILHPNPRIVAVCDKPQKLIYFTITFRSFTPTPGGLEFKPGVDYYFISTSSRNDLYRQIGGRCTSHNMKLVFKVADNRSHAPGGAGKHQVKAINVPRHYYPSDTSVPESSQPKLPGIKDFHNYMYPNRDFTDVETNSVDHSKRSEGHAGQHPNDVIKQEASVMHSSGSSMVNTHSSCLLTLLPMFWTIMKAS